MAVKNKHMSLSYSSLTQVKRGLMAVWLGERENGMSTYIPNQQGCNAQWKHSRDIQCI